MELMSRIRSHQRRQNACHFETVAPKDTSLGISEGITIHAIASKYGIHPTQVSEWKKQAIEGMDETFGSKKSKRELQRVEKENEMLKKLVGQRELELNWLTKKSRNSWL